MAKNNETGTAVKAEPGNGSGENAFSAGPLMTIRDLQVCYRDKTALTQINLDVYPGRWLMIIGPNGAGKSTLIRTISQEIPWSGTILYRGKNIRKWNTRSLAREIAVLAQTNYVEYPFTVEEVVSLGRYAYRGGLLGSGDPEGQRKIADAMERTGILEFADKAVTQLSGGELQRVFLAQIFAQDPQLLILDEPTNHLDLVYQKQVFELMKEWLGKNKERAVISVVHDLSLARSYGTDALLLCEGKNAGYGKTEEVFRPELLENVYQIDIYQWMNEMLSQWK